jgi:hypothetical protein
MWLLNWDRSAQFRVAEGGPNCGARERMRSIYWRSRMSHLSPARAPGRRNSPSNAELAICAVKPTLNGIFFGFDMIE